MKWSLRAIVIFSTIIVSGFLLYTIGFQKDIILKINNQVMEIQSSSWTVGELLQEEGITLTEHDFVDPPLSSFLSDDQVISIQQASWITINEDGQSRSVFGIIDSIEDLLSELDIDLAPGDLLYLDGSRASPGSHLVSGSNHSLQIISAKPLAVKNANNPETYLTSAPTIGLALWQNEIELDAGDALDLPIDSPIDGPVQVEIDQSKEISIQFSDGEVHTRTSAATVGEALAESGFALQGLDYSQPAGAEPLPDNGTIKVVRVKEEQILESETIPFDTETQPVADLEIDQRSIVENGVLGLKTKRIRVRFEDGKEISRQVEDEYVSQPPQNEIIGYGTNIVPLTLDVPGGQITYWRVLDMYAVSYNVTSNGGYGTATGVPLAKGVAAIDPSYIPYGTRMYVPGYGEALAADTGGGINGRMIDLGYLDEDYVSWHQWVKVYFLWPPPENVVWVIP